MNESARMNKYPPAAVIAAELVIKIDELRAVCQLTAEQVIKDRGPLCREAYNLGDLDEFLVKTLNATFDVLMAVKPPDRRHRKKKKK